ncbi:MAG: RNA polymerase sigma factor [Hyphomicrobiales bacterium]
MFPRLWRYCLVLTGAKDRADDLAQMACLRALEKADLFQPGTKLDRWIFTIAQRIWFNELRKQAVRTGGGLAPVEEIDLPDTKNDPETNLLAREVLLQVMGLPEAQRVTVMLVYVEGYSYKEASGILDIPIGTVMSRLSAARKKLTATPQTASARKESQNG